MSVATLNRIIHQDLQGTTRKKYRVLVLSNNQIAQRVDRGLRFLQSREEERHKKIITTDECWIYLSDTGSEKEMHYEFKERKTEESWTKIW